MASKLSRFMHLCLFRFSSTPTPSHTTHGSAATAAAATGLGSLNHHHKIIKKNNPNLSPTTLIKLLNSDPDPVSASRLFRWASCQRSFRHSPATYAHLISKLGLAGKSQEMEEFLGEMVRLHFHSPDVELSLFQFQFQSLIESFSSNRRPREALKVFEAATSAKFRFSVSTCNTLLSAIVRERLHLEKVVLFVYKEMVKAGICPNVDTWNWLIQALVENDHIDLALDQFARMEKKQKNEHCRPNTQTFEILIGGLCSCGRVDEAISIANQMLENESVLHDLSFYASIITWFCRVQRFDEAIKLFRLMKNDGFSPDLCLYGDLIESLCESLRLDDAVQMFDEMLESGLTPDTSVHVDIVSAYCKLGKLNEAISFLEENNVFDVEPYKALLKGFCDEGRTQEAKNYLNTIQQMGTGDGGSWNILINCLCQKGHVRKALEVLGRMIVSSHIPDAGTYSSIITGLCKLTSYDCALVWFRNSIVKGVPCDSESCSELIKGLCRMEKIQVAVEVFHSITRKGCALNTDALDILIEGLCIRRMVNEAIKLRSIALCDGIASSSSTYEIIMLRLLELNKEKDLLPLFSQMLLEGCTLAPRNYHILICGLSSESTSWTAALLFNQMVQEGFIPDTEMVERLVYRASKYYQLHMVVHSLLKVVEAVVMKSPTVCNMIIFGLLKEGYMHEARKILDWMLEKGWVPDPNTHGLLVGKLNVAFRNKNNTAYEDGDGVTNILLEGLGNSS